MCFVFVGHRNVYVGVHVPYGRKHHHRHHRHRHHRRKHGDSRNGLTVNNDAVDNALLSMSGGVIDPTTPVNPCDRVKFILGEEETGMVGAGSSCGSNMASCTSRQLFTEMDELCCYPDHRMEWKETARLDDDTVFISWCIQTICPITSLGSSVNDYICHF